jgi:hypothetical protein
MNFAELRATVERIHNNTGDAVSQLDWRLYNAGIRVDKAEEALASAPKRSKKLRQYKDSVTKARAHVAHLEKLLSVAETIICEHCGYIITDEHEFVDHSGWDEPNEETCNQAGITIVPF